MLSDSVRCRPMLSDAIPDPRRLTSWKNEIHTNKMERSDQMKFKPIDETDAIQALSANLSVRL